MQDYYAGIDEFGTREDAEERILIHDGMKFGPATDPITFVISIDWSNKFPGSAVVEIIRDFGTTSAAVVHVIVIEDYNPTDVEKWFADLEQAIDPEAYLAHAKDYYELAKATGEGDVVRGYTRLTNTAARAAHAAKQLAGKVVGHFGDGTTLTL